ncbi:hypothetical protein TIFTF001_023038 [Ficus carica]|uniref:Uncharacterized protein n=1 Tax=Ficus carica TaxID=3494 RepID=A0AA88DDB5_FICCA|nr:hypothetical protein TIFTF001_023038 [Ficus carica]
MTDRSASVVASTPAVTLSPATLRRTSDRAITVAAADGDESLDGAAELRSNLAQPTTMSSRYLRPSSCLPSPTDLHRRDSAKIADLEIVKSPPQSCCSDVFRSPFPAT